MQATAPVEDWVDAPDDEAPGKLGFVIETELATELATVEEGGFTDRVVEAD
jgi:hypothetical protein